MKTFIAYINNQKVEVKATTKQDARCKLQKTHKLHWSEIII